MLAIFVGLYILLTLGIGIYAGKFVSNSDDFIMAGRKLPLMLSSFALFALWFGSETIFGASSEFAKHGLLGVIEDPFGGVLCLVLFGLIFVRPLYRMKIITLGDLFRNRYGSLVEYVASFCMLLTFFGYIAAQLLALGFLLEIILGIPLIWGIVGSAIFVTTYTIFGGMWAISLTDFLQSIVIIIGLIAVSVSLTIKSGGLENIMKDLPDDFLDFYPKQANLTDWSNYIAAWITLGLGSLASQDIFQRANAAKSEKVAVQSTLLGAAFYMTIAILPLFISLVAKLHYPEMVTGDSQQILSTVVLNFASFPVQVLFFGALLSAIFSTCSGAVLAPATILSENILRPFYGEKMDDHQFLWLTRISVFVMAMLATLLATYRSNIYELVGESSILGLVTLLAPMTAAIFWSRASKWGALCSMFLGLSTYLLMEYYFVSVISSIIWGFLASTAAMISGSYLFPQNLKSEQTC
jgi:SSS family transporter